MAWDSPRRRFFVIGQAAARAAHGRGNLEGPSVYVLLYMLDCATAVACVVMGLEATEDRKAAVREGGDKNAEGKATLPL